MLGVVVFLAIVAAGGFTAFGTGLLAAVVPSPTPMPTQTPSPSPTLPRHLITGVFRLVGSYGGFVGGGTASAMWVMGPEGSETCYGLGGYGDIRAGTPVTLRDGDGRIISTSSFATGIFRDVDILRGVCTFTFALDNVPEAAFYGVEVSRRGQVNYSIDQMRSSGWMIVLTLGQ